MVSTAFLFHLINLTKRFSVLVCNALLEQVHPTTIRWVVTRRTEALPGGEFMAVGSSNLPISRHRISLVGEFFFVTLPAGEFMAIGSSNRSIGGHGISLVGEFFVTVTMRSLLSWYWVPSYAAC
jgi:hypothetical protein